MFGKFIEYRLLYRMVHVNQSNDHSHDGSWIIAGRYDHYFKSYWECVTKARVKNLQFQNNGMEQRLRHNRFMNSSHFVIMNRRIGHLLLRTPKCHYYQIIARERHKIQVNSMRWSLTTSVIKSYFTKDLVFGYGIHVIISMLGIWMVALVFTNIVKTRSACPGNIYGLKSVKYW